MQPIRQTTDQQYDPLFASGTRPAATTAVPDRPASIQTHHATMGWQVLAGQILPQLIASKLVEGINAVRKNRAGEWVTSDLGIELERLGRAIIPHDVLPPEEAAAGRKSVWYTPQGRPGLRLHYCERAIVGSKDTVCDETRWHRYLGWLVESGTIQPPSLHALELLLQRLRDQHDQVARKAADVPSYREASERLASDIAAVQTAIEAARATAETVAEADDGPAVDDLGVPVDVTPLRKRGRA
jgi:hypothetical protein